MKLSFSSVVKAVTFLVLLLTNTLFYAIADIPKIPMGEKLDMNKFEETPVFSDEFNGSSLDRSKWSHHCGEALTIRRGSYWDMDMAQVYDGALHIKTEYLKDGLNGKGAGWYTAGIDTSESYEQTYGYFECRCILPEGHGHWSAFWMLSDGMSSTKNGGIDGAEIDVMESAFWYDPLYRNSTAHTIHIDGYGEHHDSRNDGKWHISGDPYNEFHTYGVEWNENGYTFYIDGKVTSKTNFGGASQVPEFMILSVEVGGENGIPEDSWAGPSIETNEGGLDFKSDFVVDYVRAYQYK